MAMQRVVLPPNRTRWVEGDPVTPEEFVRIAIADDVAWELHEGRLREKPAMSLAHNRSISRLSRQLLPQLDEQMFEVRINGGHLQRSESTFYIPDLFVVAANQVAEVEDRPGVLETYAQPLPLVIEVWSISTGTYDVEDKLPEYQRRGDLEIWRVHPYERTLTIWRRRSDGGYDRSVVAGGIIRPIALPGVEIDLDALFR